MLEREQIVKALHRLSELLKQRKIEGEMFAPAWMGRRLSLNALRSCSIVVAWDRTAIPKNRILFDAMSLGWPGFMQPPYPAEQRMVPMPVAG
jgi:hypothetical protein